MFLISNIVPFPISILKCHFKSPNSISITQVRKQSHTCLKDMLQSFQRLNILVPASEDITSTFERFLLLAGGSNSQDQTEGERSKGAIEVLYMLGALKECLPLMAPKPTNIILKYCKTLLGLHQPVVIRGVLEILQAICVRETNGIDPVVLLDLLCSIGLSVPVEEKSGDELAAVARLLCLGMKKVYNLNKEMVVMKLPLVFNSLRGMHKLDYFLLGFQTVIKKENILHCTQITLSLFNGSNYCFSMGVSVILLEL